MELKERILREADQLFHAYGIRSVSMDDIARKAGVSKKTIYQYYADKDDLVSVMVHEMLSEDMRAFEAIATQAKDAIEEMLLGAEQVKKMIRTVNPVVVFDLQKYHPKAWSVYKNFKEQYFLGALIKLLHRGIEEGYFRKELNVEVLAKMRVEQVQLGFDPTLFPFDKYNVMDVQWAFFDHFIHGIVTLKGYSKLIQYRQMYYQNEKLTQPSFS
ncbi:MAG: TetR/AcrR family transcriptional regulator [Cytophagales bacterium]|nr:TetR/AcrR family transcriptional regulator [Bernardetiaceae bacterium]MDW8204702.1 TetR/AcrR family transcriptional regulator [Cytophagales bacterium]